MSVYQRTNLAFPKTIFGASLTEMTALLSSNASVLAAAFFAPGATIVTTLVLDAHDGSTITLTGSLTLSQASASPLTKLAAGAITGVTRTTAAGMIETISGFSLPVEIRATQTALVSSNVDLSLIAAGSDTLNGGSAADILIGLGGADAFNAGGGDDTLIFGRVANEVVTGETINGGAGTDTIVLRRSVDFTAATSLLSIERIMFDYSGSTNNLSVATFSGAQFSPGGMPTNLAIVGVNGKSDNIDVEMRASTSFSAAGFQLTNWETRDGVEVSGDADAETIIGSSGLDVIDGGLGADVLDGGPGRDGVHYGSETRSVVIFLGGAEPSTVWMDGVGEDVIRNFENVDTGDGDDVIVGDGGDNLMRSGYGDDLIFGAGFVDGVMSTAAGKDMIDAGPGDDAVFMGAEDDFAIAGIDNDSVVAGGGADVVFGGWGRDFLFGGAFSSVDGSFLPGSGNDRLNGTEDNDAIWGFDGDDVLDGEKGFDYIEGNEGKDTINGGDDNDFILGGAGDDILSGGTGYDYIYGGPGADLFIIRKNDSADWILDFNPSQGDSIRFEGFGFVNAGGIPLVDLSTTGNPAVQLTFTAPGGVDQITFFGVQLGQLSASNMSVA